MPLETLESSDSVPEGPSTLGGGGGTSPGSTLPNLGRRTDRYMIYHIVNYPLPICCISDLGSCTLQCLGACPEGSCLIGTVALGLGGLGCRVQVLDGGAGGVECGDCLETVAGPRLQTSLHI